MSAHGTELGLKWQGDHFYLRKPGSQEQLGDERISFKGIPTAGTATYFGAIRGHEGIGKQFDFKKGLVSQFIRNDGMLHHLLNGTREQALKSVNHHLWKLKWTVRLIGTAGVIAGLLMLLSKFLHFLITIPVLGQMAELGVFLASLILGLTISLTTIISSMVYHNPWTAFAGLGLVAALVSVLLLVRNQTRANARRRLQALSPSQQLPTSADAEGLSVEASAQRVKHVYCNLVKLAMSDGQLDKAENLFLANWGRAKGMTDESIVELFD